MTPLYIGLMSGTSLDGIDAVLVDLSSRPRLVASHHLPFPGKLRRDLIRLSAADKNELERAAFAGAGLSQLYAEAIRLLLGGARVAARRVAAIGCHGQTVRHRPDLGYTVQLANAALLAEIAGISVVADFRSRDIAAGGEGAPLVPAFHAACFRDRGRQRAIVNIGGIANVTLLPPKGPVRGFDTGPGNLLLDAWVARHRRRDYDDNGRWAHSGTVERKLLQRMLANEFFRRSPPKSTGRERFNPAWLETFAVARLAPRDVQATLAELTACSIATAIRRFAPATQEVYVCGGGAHNGDLLDRLRADLKGMEVESSQRLGIHPDWVEAMAFAWLAKQAIDGRPGNVPEVTGARGPRVLGAIYPA